MKRQSATNRVADQVHFREAEGIKQLRQLVHPHLEPGRCPLWQVLGMFAVAVTDQVRREALELLGQGCRCVLPGGPGGRPRSGAVQEKDGLSLVLSCAVQVSLVIPGPDDGVRYLAQAFPLQICPITDDQG